MNENGSVAGPRRPFSEVGSSSRLSFPTVLLTSLKFVRLSKIERFGNNLDVLVRAKRELAHQAEVEGKEVGPDAGVAARTPGAVGIGMSVANVVVACIEVERGERARGQDPGKREVAE